MGFPEIPHLPVFHCWPPKAWLRRPTLKVFACFLRSVNPGCQVCTPKHLVLLVNHGLLMVEEVGGARKVNEPV